MSPLDTVCGELARLAPLRLAEDWDNVGLLVGDRGRSIGRIMTCLTITPNVVEEAISQAADLIVTHHPLPFKPLSRITTDTITGSMLLKLIANQVAVYSAHTAFDSAAEGINQMWAERLGLSNIRPLIEWDIAPAEVGEKSADETAAAPGSGRFGELTTAEPLGQLVARAAALVRASAPRMVGDPERAVVKVALACGSGGSFLSAAARHGCELMITGEATFHLCLEAEARGIGLGLLGHYFSERFAMEQMAEGLAQTLPDMVVWPSQSEHDPLNTVPADRGKH